MNAPRKPPTGPPPSAGVLAKYARTYPQELGVGEGRVRAWISYMVFAGLLDRSAGEAAGYRFTIKGGVALEGVFVDLGHREREFDGCVAPVVNESVAQALHVQEHDIASAGLCEFFKVQPGDLLEWIPDRKRGRGQARWD